MWIIIEVGCLECGNSSYLIGVFDTKEKALQISKELDNKYDTSDVAFPVFKLGEINQITSSNDLR
jgi:hypothetical protein